MTGYRKYFAHRCEVSNHWRNVLVHEKDAYFYHRLPAEGVDQHASRGAWRVPERRDRDDKGRKYHLEVPYPQLSKIALYASDCVLAPCCAQPRSIFQHGMTTSFWPHEISVGIDL